MIMIPIIVGTLLRLVGVNQSLWLDEAISALAAKNFSYIGLVTQFAKYDFHPPLFYLILKLWGSIFGYSEVALRALPIIFGLAAIILVAKVARELKLKPFWTALMVATSPLYIYYSQEVRMYPLAAFFVLLALYSVLKIVQENRRIYYALLSVSILLFSSLDYLTLLVIPGVAISLALIKNKKGHYVRFALVFLPFTVIALLWLPTLIFQLNSARGLAESLPLWRNIIGSPTLKEIALVGIKFVIGRVSFYNKIFYSLFVVVCAAPFAYAFFCGLKAVRKIVVIWFFLPLVLGFVISFFVPAFSYFRFLFLLPIFYLIVVAGVKKVWLYLLLLLVNMVCTSVYFLNTNLWREDWKSAVSYVEQESQSSDIAVFEFEEPVAAWQWYSTGKVSSYGLLDTTLDTLPSAQNIWYFEYLADITDPDQAKLVSLKNAGYAEVYEQSFRGVGKIIKLSK